MSASISGCIRDGATGKSGVERVVPEPALLAGAVVAPTSHGRRGRLRVQSAVRLTVFLSDGAVPVENY